MNQFPITTLADVAFSQEIIKRYQQGKRVPFNFPLMIFYKNRGPGLSVQIDVDILVQLHMHARKRGVPVTAGNIQTMKRLSSLSGSEKRIPQSIITPALLQSVRNMHTISSRIRETATSPFFSATQMFVNRMPGGSSIQSRLSQGPLSQTPFSQIGDSAALEVAFYPQAAPRIFFSDRSPVPFLKKGILLSQILFGPSSPKTLSHLRQAKLPGIYSHAETLQFMQVNPFLLTELTERGIFPAKQDFPLLMSKALFRNTSSRYIVGGPQYREYVLGIWNTARQTWKHKNNPVQGLTNQYNTSQNARISQSLASIAPPVFYPQAAYQISSNTGKHHSALKQDDYTYILPPLRAESPNTRIPGNISPSSSIHKTTFEGYRAMSLLGKNTLMLNIHKGLLTRTVQPGMVMHYPLIQPAYNVYESARDHVAPTRRRQVFEASKQDLSLRTQRKIEQEVKELKKIVIEAQQAVSDTSSNPSRDMVRNPQIDIQDLSDQVYQLLDRKIKIEAERRGLL